MLKRIQLLFAVLLLIPSLFGQSQLVSNLNLGDSLPPVSIKKDRVNTSKTASSLFLLSVLTVAPLIQGAALANNPEYRNEFIISISLTSIPALIGWPLFFKELYDARRR